MITAFHNEAIEQVWQGSFTKKLPNQIQAIARRKLRMINNARIIDDLRIPPALTTLRNFQAIVMGNGASVSTTNGGFASYGIAATLRGLKFVTTSDRRERQWKDSLTSTPAKYCLKSS